MSAQAPAPSNSSNFSSPSPPPYSPPPSPYQGLTPPPPSTYQTCSANSTLLLCQPDYTNYSDGRIVTSLWIFAAVGGVCLLVFGVLRNRIGIYQTRLDLPNVPVRPPKLPLGGISQLWSWLYPVFSTSDAEIVHTSGLDSLMVIWTTTMGIQLLLPLMILGLIILLPVNMTGNRSNANSAQQNVSGFTRLTLANLSKGSALYWVPFVYVYIVILYTCWLLVKYYQQYVVLRQHYLTGGEALINEWHQQFMEHKEQEVKEGGHNVIEKRDKKTILQNIRRMFDPSHPMDTIAEELDDAASGISSRKGPIGAALTRINTMQRRNSFTRSNSDKGHWISNAQSKGPSLASASVGAHSGRMAEARVGSFTGGRSSSSRMSPARSGSPQGLTRSLTSSRDSSPPCPHPPTDAPDGIRSDSLQERPVHSGALPVPSRLGLQPLDTIQPHMDLQRQSAEATAHTPHRLSRVSPQAAVRQSIDSRHVSQDGSNDLMGTRDGAGEHHAPTQANMERPSAALSPQQSTTTVDLFDSPVACDPVSLYETHMHKEDDAGRERVTKWWKARQLADGRTLVGKPSVAWRKVVNADSGDGAMVGVNAQQYVVLVMDVPNLQHERRTLKRRAARRRWWWRLWFNWTVFFRRHIMLQTNVMDRQTLSRAGSAAVSPALKAAASRDLEAAEKGSLARKASQTPKAPPKEPLAPTKGATTNPLFVDSPPEAPSKILGTLKDPQSNIQAVKAPLPPNDITSDHPRSALGSNPSVGAQQNVNAKARAREESDGAVTSPFQEASMKAASDRESDANEDDDLESLYGQEVSSDELVRSTFSFLFPNTFQDILPVYNHKKLDLLLLKWNKACAKLEAAEAAFLGGQRPQCRIGGCCCCGGEMVDAIDHWAEHVRKLEKEIVEEREQVLAEGGAETNSYFVFFSSQTDAAVAAQANLHPEDGHSFRVVEAPGPEEVNWSALWLSWQGRDIREIVVLIPILIFLLIPIGLFSGAVAQLTVGVCGNVDGKFYSAWWCKQNNTARAIVTAILPSILLTVWQTVVMPLVLYRCVLAEGRWPSFSSVDRRIAALFFVWDVFNVFIGAMLGGSIFSQLDNMINDPGSIPRLIGTALPASSNFFIKLPGIAGSGNDSLQQMFQHVGMLPTLFRLCGCCTPKIWDSVFTCVVWSLFIMELFTGCIFMANGSYAQATILWVTTTPFLYKFHQYCTIRYGQAVKHIPLEMAAAAPPAQVNPRVYLPPALRPGCTGWHPEYGKAWRIGACLFYTF
ncbi:hypothetical protein WJX73_000229 [Symbiochloris irregularis]|uniref:CSC1/OSCA1-like 7TM region domain-containing protein n=1 Tax=Symbiochloris irregularis TaxID=706552 RepID=A0AAW1P936_9CHLO